MRAILLLALLSACDGRTSIPVPGPGPLGDAMRPDALVPPDAGPAVDAAPVDAPPTPTDAG